MSFTWEKTLSGPFLEPHISQRRHCQAYYVRYPALQIRFYGRQTNHMGCPQSSRTPESSCRHLPDTGACLLAAKMFEHMDDLKGSLQLEVRRLEEYRVGSIRLWAQCR